MGPRFRAFLMFAAGVIAILIGSASHASMIVFDQANLPLFTTLLAAGFGGQTNERGQTFTVGAGGRLESISVAIARFNAGQTNNVIFRVYDTVGGLPDSVLAAVTLSATTFPVGAGVTDPFVFVSIPLAPFNIWVTPGDVLAFTGVTSGTEFFGMKGGSKASSYTAGNRIVRSLPNGAFQVDAFSPTADFAFWTLVDTDPPGVPEPSSLALLSLGTVGLIGRRWRRKSLLWRCFR